MNVTLPNGYTIEGVPEGTSKEDIMAKAISSGVATQEDFGAPVQEQPVQAPVQEPKTGAIDATLQGGAQGATFGWGDELSAGLATALTTQSNTVGDMYFNLQDMLGLKSDRETKVQDLYKKERASPSETYKRIRNEMRADYTKAKEDRPGYALTGEILGGVLTSVIPGGAVAKTGSLGKTALASAVAGGTYAAGSSEADNLLDLAKDTAIGAGTGAVAGPLVSKAVSGVGAVVNKVKDFTSNKASKLLNEAMPSSNEIKKVSSKLYKEVDESGLLVSSTGMKQLTDKVRNTIKDFGFDPEIQPKINAILKKFEKSEGGPLPIKELENLRKVVQNAGKSTDGGEAALSSKIVNTMDDFLDDLAVDPTLALNPGKAAGVVDKLKQARSLWAKKSKLETIQEIANKAKDSRSNFEDGVANEFRSLLKKKNGMRGFTEQEQSAIREIADGGSIKNTLDKFGELGAGGKNRMGGGLSMLALALNPAIGLSTIVGATFSKAIANKMNKKAFDKLTSLVTTGSPDALAVTKAYIAGVPKGKQTAKELSALLGSSSKLEAFKAKIAKSPDAYSSTVKQAVNEALTKASVQQSTN